MHVALAVAATLWCVWLIPLHPPPLSNETAWLVYSRHLAFKQTLLTLAIVASIIAGIFAFANMESHYNYDAAIGRATALCRPADYQHPECYTQFRDGTWRRFSINPKTGIYDSEAVYPGKGSKNS